MAEDFMAKYNNMTQTFKGQSENLMKDILNGFSQVMDGSKQNYLKLQDSYAKGYSDIILQSKAANGELLQNMDRNYKDLKANIDSMHQQLKGSLKQAYEASISQFRAQCADIVKKFNFLPHDAHIKAIENLTTLYNTTLSDFDKRHSAVLADLEKKYADLIKEVKIPEVQPPKLTIPTLNTGSSATVSPAGTSKK